MKMKIGWLSIIHNSRGSKGPLVGPLSWLTTYHLTMLVHSQITHVNNLFQHKFNFKIVETISDPHKRKYRVIYSYEPSESDADVELQLNVDDIIDFIAEVRKRCFGISLEENCHNFVFPDIDSVIVDTKQKGSMIYTIFYLISKFFRPQCNSYSKQ